MSSTQDHNSPKGAERPQGPQSPKSPRGKTASPQSKPASPALVPLSEEELREADILPATHWTQEPVILTSLPVKLLNDLRLTTIHCA